MNAEPPQRVEASLQLPADKDVSQSVGQSSINPGARQDQGQPRLEADDREPLQASGHALELEFQDSNLSPALSLLPVNSRVDHNFTEYSLFQQSENEFAPLRAYPDMSMASERFHFPPQDRTTQASERGSLSQHPLAHATILSEEGTSSLCSLSQHSLPPGDDDREASRGDGGHREKHSQTLTDLKNKLAGEAVEDDTFFLRKDIPAQHLLDILQKEVGMPSSSSSAVSSASEMSVKSITSYAQESKSSKIESGTHQSFARREGPPGEASLPQQQTQQPDPSQTLSSEVCNITMGSRSTLPDDSSEVLYRELLSEAERHRSREAGSVNQQQKSASPPGQFLTETSDSKPSVTRKILNDPPWTGPSSSGVERLHREQDLWSSGNQTGIDGSYLGFLPQSQSTPGVFKAPPKSNVKATLGKLSAIESDKDSSDQSRTGISPQPAVPEPDVHGPDSADQCHEEHTSAKVQSLPSLNYMQKVDAWRENQSSGKTSLFDSLALQGFSGVSPKKKAYDVVSDSLNRILSQQVRSVQQPLVSSAHNENVPQKSSAAPSGSASPRRGEAVGSAPSDKDNTGSAARPSSSPSGRSQSHSSLSTVVMSAQKENEKNDEVHRRQPSASAQPSPLVNLGQFSDVSLDVTLSSSQDSYNNGVKLGTSIGASSVTSLEVDNYAPYWTSKLSTTPPLPEPRELNIEERIPLYLHNLGIDQSPATILTPFAPRGPIREPEFSPTDLCTIKGSIGTPTRSTQPSEGGSPHKGEFSRCSILSVDSSVSIPFSLDSLGPAMSIPEPTKRASPPTDAEAAQTECRLTPASKREDDSLSSTLELSQQQQKDGTLTSSQNTFLPGERFDSDLSSITQTRSGERDLESPLQTSRSLGKSAEDSFVSSKALLEIHNLLSQADKASSAGSSGASSASPAARLLSDDDILLSLRRKTSKVQDAFSGTEDPRTPSSSLWARSSSDSMLTSEKPRQSSLGRESMTSSWQPDNPSTQSLTTARAAGSTLVLSKSARRAEPEGCSAAPPDNKVPTQPPAIKSPPAVNTQQLISTSAETAALLEVEEKPAPGGPAQSRSSSPAPEDTDQGALSDESSESSLAVRVAKLLQSESPATMMSSTPSITDQEESRAREWIKLKISGQQCEPLELDVEDRRRIEEIKKELLLKYPMKSQLSTDTESSAGSSVRVQRGQDPPQSAGMFTTPDDATNLMSQPLHGLRTNLSDSSVQNPHRPETLEAQVQKIAAREGVTLPRTNPRALTSISIATCRRSTSPSPSTSPAPPISPASEPLHPSELSTAVEHLKVNRPPPQNEEKTTREPTSGFEPSSRLYTWKQSRNSQLMSGNQKRQDAVGGQFEKPPSPLQVLNREDVNITDDNTQSFHRDDLFTRDISASGVHGAERTTESSTSESPAVAAHVSRVHLTLSTKAADRSLASTERSSPADAATVLPRREFVLLRHSPSTASSPDEGVGLSSPPEWYETRGPREQRGLERADTSTLFKSVVPHQRVISAPKQAFTPRHRPDVSRRALTNESPAVPVLLPYKPRGSEELFYVPQLEADVSSTGPSDTSMESSHTGSDDAVPPRFSSEVLGRQDPGLDRGVTTRHTEGIYSKRLKTASFKMQEPGHRDSSVTADKSSQTSANRSPRPSSHVSAAFTRVHLPNNQEASTRDQGTSPMLFTHYDRPETSRETVQPVHVETKRRTRHHLDQSSVPQTGGHQQTRDPDASQQSNISLDELWQRFCDRWTIEQSRPTSDREASLLQRLERLSRLIHSTRGTRLSELQEEDQDPCTSNQKLGRRREDATRGDRRPNAREDDGSLLEETKPPVPHQAQRTSQPAAENSHSSFASSLSHNSSQSLHLSPADASDTLSTASGSMSSVDTARLIRVFGSHRVKQLKSGSSLFKLYNTINKQKEGREQRRGRHGDVPHLLTPLETTGADESSAPADSVSSTSTYTPPSHRGPSKKTVKLVSKGIQTAGDLEIVRNATRRHTRDVGTTFPSPHETSASGRISSSSPSVQRGRGGQKKPAKIQSSQKQRKSKRSPSKLYPAGVSWFISADDLRSEAKKENQQQAEEPTLRPSTAWFEPHSRTQAWREPLRQRQVHEDRSRRQTEPDPKTKTISSGLTHVSLQEALEMSRPGFISRSTQRVKCLALQAEERKLQAVFIGERDELFNQPRGQGRLPRPAGTALLRRAVPRKEMIQRSKQIYENLPEVQRRREEERRRAEYRSYRLNAQLYNKRITNRVLGRRTAWQ
ncbi:serine-rich adhesin for platelets [Paralichthys olivaceus]|uniref:serine-rich adhesin for platelets n=1 Tax=Paralichthys olivaceus TaxID=8255 RepID=UPI003751F275